MIESGAVAEQLQRLSQMQERLADLAGAGRTGPPSGEAEPESSPPSGTPSRRWRRRSTA